MRRTRKRSGGLFSRRLGSVSLSSLIFSQGPRHCPRSNGGQWLDIGWAISNRIKQDLAIRALNMAVALRRPTPGCIHHTDRESQYCAHDCQELMRQHGLKPSMIGKGNCYDRAILRHWFKHNGAVRRRPRRFARTGGAYQLDSSNP